jgi:nicotinamidase/pyrazinamidase
MPNISLTGRDALIIVDVQRDFIDGTLPVPGATHIIPVLNGYIGVFVRENLPIYATRDWHPAQHCSFGTWPAHCVQYTEGAAFAPDLLLPDSAVIISKGTATDADAYSGFQGTDLNRRLQAQNIERLFIGGLALDVCVFNTVMDALREGYQVFVLEDAALALNRKPGSGAEAVTVMRTAGAGFVTLGQLA